MANQQGKLQVALQVVRYSIGTVIGSDFDRQTFDIGEQHLHPVFSEHCLPPRVIRKDAVLIRTLQFL